MPDPDPVRVADAGGPQPVDSDATPPLVRELFDNADVAGDVQKALPPQLAPLAGPAAAGLQQLAGQLAPRVLASPQAQAAWVGANAAAHKQLLKVLDGGGPVVSTYYTEKTLVINNDT